MAYTVTQRDILALPADAAVLCVENVMRPSVGACNERLRAAGGEALEEALRKRRFLPVGSAWAIGPCGLPYRHLIITTAPRWWGGECNELPVLRYCYDSVFAQAKALGCRSLALPFLSAAYYRFPQREAVQIALAAAGESELELYFAAETEQLLTLSLQADLLPKIVSYLGYYRDHAAFLLSNGWYAKVDLRPELRDVELREYVEPCYREKEGPDRPPLPEEEIRRLRRIYESFCFGKERLQCTDKP